jgi:eukaryotic-like serine/threonine-protein kinase
MSLAEQAKGATTARVGVAAPAFELMCVDSSGDSPRQVSLGDYRGRWLGVIFYPRDFSFVCPTELTAFSAQVADFRQRGCDLLGVSVDSIPLHREWLATPPGAGGLGPLQYPLASDPSGDAARAFGVWDAEEKVSLRGLFLIDPDGVLQYAVVHNLSVGRSAVEVLRVLDALQSGGLCPASWTSADGVIDPEAALQPGRVVGHYRIRRQLGSGTFGAVFAAWDMHLERLVALKVLKRNIAESRKALLDEARAAARLNHPHVCTIYAVEEADGLPLIVMEHLEGRALSEMIRQPLDEPTALRLAGQIAAGLATAHQYQVVHGDFKPANVIVSGEGIAKILDFGLSRSQRERGGATLAPRRDELHLAAGNLERLGSGAEATIDLSLGADPRNSLRGTPAYMSPEQAAGEPATPASDAFSFGLALFEMLTGQSAHGELPLVKLIVRLQTADLASELASLVPPRHRELVSALLARAPPHRPTLAAVAQHLARF